MQPFNIQCTTCRRNLRVTSPEAFGRILSCPKCGSFVMVEAPPGWSPVAEVSKPEPVAKSQGSNVKKQESEVTKKGSGDKGQESGSKQPEAGFQEYVSGFSNPQSIAASAGANPAELIGGNSAREAVEKATVWKDAPVEAAPQQVAQAAEMAAAVHAAGFPSKVDQVFQAAPAVDEHAAVNAWPRWFWPGVAVAVVLGVLILSMRLLLHSSKESTQPNAVATANSSANESYAAPVANSASQSIPPQNKAASEQAPAAQTASDHAVIQETAPRTEDTKPKTANQPTAVADPQSAPPSADKTADNPATQAPVATEPSPSENNRVVEMSAGNVATGSEVPGSSPIIPPPLPVPTTDVSSATGQSAEGATALPPPLEPQPAPRTLKRVPPRAVNIVASLADSVPDIDVQGQPLVDFLEFISAMSTVPISMDIDAVCDLGQTAASPVQLHLTDASVAEVLQTALEPLRLGYQLRDGQLLVGYPPQEKLRQVRYNVADLVGDDSAALAELGAVVRRMIAPASWQQVGGKATMVAGKSVLLVEQTEPAHAQILNFCEKLRVARGLVLKSRYDPSRFVLNTRQDKAQELLAKPISANFAVPMPLADAIKWLRQATGAVIVIDHQSLAREGMSAESECQALAVNKPLAKLLDDMTASADLTWRGVDERTIEITSHSAALARMDVEFYPARNLATDAAAAEKLIAQIKAKVEPQLWGDTADKLADLGAIHFDSLSGALVVRAPQRVQSQVEAELAAQRSRK